MKIKYEEINKICVGNFVQYNGNVYTVYDMEEDLIYLDNPDLQKIGIPYSKIRPILLNPHVMSTCCFRIDGQPYVIYSGTNKVKTFTKYVLDRERFKDFDFSVSVEIEYDMEKDIALVIDTLTELDPNMTKIQFLHQVQNVFRQVYGYNLLELT
jgi:hypothetical protein